MRGVQWLIRIYCGDCERGEREKDTNGLEHKNEGVSWAGLKR